MNGFERSELGGLGACPHERHPLNHVVDLFIRPAQEFKMVETYLNKSIIQYEHNGREIPSPCLAPEEHLTDIADVSDIWVAQAELPNDKGGVEDETSNDNGQYQARYQSKDRVGVWERHDGQTYVLGEEEGGSLLYCQ
jgi:hypothetical protein